MHAQPANGGENPIKRCFIVSAIGEKGSPTRARSDKVLNYILRPVCQELGYVAQRADEIDEPGLITRRVILRLLDSELVIADLSERNPNVFYEVAIRHFTGKPLIQIIEHGETIPFDVFDFSTIAVDHRDIESIEHCKKKLHRYIQSIASKQVVENPVIEALRAMNVTVPVLGARQDPLKQFQDLSERILKEIHLIRSERSVLLEKIGEMAADAQGGNAVGVRQRPAPYELSGIWQSGHGLVKLAQHGDEILGEYEFGGKRWVGDITGRIIRNRIVFAWRWKRDEFAGVGYWAIRDGQLRGGWWYPPPTYQDLLRDPDLVERLRDIEIWNLAR